MMRSLQAAERNRQTSFLSYTATDKKEDIRLRARANVGGKIHTHVCALGRLNCLMPASRRHGSTIIRQRLTCLRSIFVCWITSICARSPLCCACCP